MSSNTTIRVAELFAGVGGFRLGLEGYSNPNVPQFNMPAAGPFKTIWANQWEPPGTPGQQFAFHCYEARFGTGSAINEDIHVVLDAYEQGKLNIPDIDMVVGGFPCQDYSVAKPLSMAGGIEGKKGVLWWDIYRFLKLKNCPRFVLLENVDRLLKSPASQRGRDFAIILTCLANLNYSVEWRVVNSGEYGFPQRRKRTYIFAVQTKETWDLDNRLAHGIMTSAFPMERVGEIRRTNLPLDPYDISQSFNRDGKTSPFLECGAMQAYRVVSSALKERYTGTPGQLRDALVDESDVPEHYYVNSAELPKWQYLKGAKREERTNKKTGFTYFYSEGSMAFPDFLDRPSRTILTGEGGRAASRFKHIVRVNNRYRRLVPDELDRLQGFPQGWTNTGMSDGNRAFCMGNALVVGVPNAIGHEITRQYLSIPDS